MPMMDTLMIAYIVGAVLLTPAQTMVSDNTRILNYYGGALTSITCSATTPRFLINGIYTPQSYHLLPELLGIKAVIASDRSNVTLHVNGSTMAHSITVECQNIIDPITGGLESVFQLILLFTDPIPAPRDVQYNTSDGVLHWSPPHIEELGNGNISVDYRITHYIIYLIDQRIGLLMTNFTTTGPDTSLAILDAMPDLPCSLSIQVSAVNPAGEGQRSASITENQCHPKITMIAAFDDIITTQNDNSMKEISAERFTLTNGEISAVAIVSALLIVIVVAVSLSLLIVWFSKKTKHPNCSQEVTVDMKHCVAYEVTTLAKEKMVMKTNPAYEQVQINS